MKKNELSFDSFVIVEAENNLKSKSENIINSKKLKSSQNKKIRNKILEEEENYEEINNDSYKAKNKGEKGETNSFEIYEKTNNKIKEFDDYEDLDNEEEKDDKNIIKNKLEDNEFINITTFSKEKPSNFESDIILLNNKKNNSYSGKIFVDENFGVQINLITNKNNLYYNDAFYEFNLLEIKNFNTTQKYSNDDNKIEFTLKDYRNFIINFKKKRKIK